MISFAFLWIKAKSFINPVYINHIVTSIVDHTTYDCDFVCVTDQVKKSTNWNIAGYTVRAFPLAGKFSKHQHNKLEVFRRDLKLCERAVLTDMDNFIIGSIDELLEYDGTFGARRTFLPKTRPQPQLSWAELHSPNLHFIWDEAKQMSDVEINKLAPTGGGCGDQLFLYKVYGEYDRLDDLYPGALQSWKRGWDGRAKILFAHGKQKPHRLKWRWDWPWESLDGETKSKRKAGFQETDNRKLRPRQ